MLKILVVSDSHRRVANIEKIFGGPVHYDYMIHLGDVIGQQDIIREIAGVNCPCVFVAGNCDVFNREDPKVNVADYDGIRIFMTHGHMFGGGDPYCVARAGKDNDAQIALFGHTHVPFMQNIGGVEVFNPGSITNPRQNDGYCTYGVITIDGGKYKMDLYRIE